MPCYGHCEEGRLLPYFCYCLDESTLSSLAFGAGRQQRLHIKQRRAIAVPPTKVQEIAATGEGNADGKGGSSTNDRCSETSLW
ncbi:hypothetical protein BHE74_00058030 [Ensete ventricosum]|nr:hypothetical protein BHE74_00058030 [Ensete ventricosum]RZS25625.1 hypothetical protein BHM03_00058852 [Ensete ventricosum]